MRTLKILWENIFSKSKLLILLLVISSSVYAFMVLPTWFQKLYIDNVNLYLNGETTIKVIILSLTLYFVTRVITGGVLVPFGHVKDLYYEYIVTKNVNKSLHETNNKIDLEFYESSKIYNLLVRAKYAFTNGALRKLLSIISSIFTLVFSLSAIIGTLYLLKPIFAVISIISIIPLFFEEWIFTDRILKMNREIVEKRRLKEQSINHIIGKEYYLETRISGAKDYFIDKWDSLRNDIEKSEKKLLKNKLKYNLLFNLFKSVCVILIIVLATFYLMEGELTVGSYSAVLGIVGFMHMSTSYFISQVSSMKTEFKELDEVSEYYEIDTENSCNNTINEVKDIKLENVSFKYPNRERNALNNINLNIKKGEKVAILGVNGAGKTTLVNVILGLYKPTKGSIYYNDINLLSLNKESIHNKMSSVFQDFKVYNLTIEENVRLGDIKEPATKNEIITILDKAGFNYNKYNVNTFIGKEFDGIELSKGESQQLAIARSYYNKNSELVVIDEPTAALDPISEEKLYKQFLEYTDDKTAIIISHRLGSVKIADRIIVMNESRIVEEGTHEDLLKKEGLYYEMYLKQSKLYDRD